jgi:hypothetical protein
MGLYPRPRVLSEQSANPYVSVRVLSCERCYTGFVLSLAAILFKSLGRHT